MSATKTPEGTTPEGTDRAGFSSPPSWPSSSPAPSSAMGSDTDASAAGTPREGLWHGGKRSPRQRELDAVRSSSADLRRAEDGWGDGIYWGAATSDEVSEGTADPEVIEPNHEIS